MERITVNVTGKPKRVSKGGRDYLVAPLSLIVPGVLNGSQGPILYEPDEVARTINAWDGVPLVLRHPVVNGEFLSARDPDIAEHYEIGRNYRTQFTDRLASEGWFDVEAMRRVTPGVLNRLFKGEKIELSTGIIRMARETAPEGATYNGKPYTHIARDIRPDHVAVLPDEIGACSVSDGCGVNNALTHHDIRMQLSMLLAERFPVPTPVPGMSVPYESGHCYVRDVYDDAVIYERGEKCYRLAYTVKDDKVTLDGGLPVEVRQVTSYEPVANITTNEVPSATDDALSEPSVVLSQKEVFNMADNALTADRRKEIVSGLVANCECNKGDVPWKGRDEATLNALPDDTLTAFEGWRKALLAAVAAKPAEPVVNIVPIAPAPVPVVNAAAPAPAPATVPAPTPAKPLSMQDWLAQAPAEARAVWNNGLQALQRERTELLDALTANVVEDRRPGVRAIYEPMDIEQLRILASGLPASQRQPGTVNGFLLPDYSGAAGGPAHNVRGGRDDFDENDVLPLPTTDWIANAAFDPEPKRKQA